MTGQEARALESIDVSRRRLALITSGAYCNQELAVEFGRLPPSFLPVGNKRLYEYQRSLFNDATEVYLSLPADFPVPPDDIERMSTLGITLLQVPTDVSLGESVVYALNLIGGPDRAVCILHGDTLLEDILEASDGFSEVAVGIGAEGYSWAEASFDGNVVTKLETVEAGVSSERTTPVACGYFSFSHSSALVREITRAGGDFIKGICGYSTEHVIHKREVSGWFDFGHVQTYFRSRRMVTSARAFNCLRIDGRVARKSSDDAQKMRAEARWFASVPPNVRLFSARLMDHGEDKIGVYYETEYEYLPTLAELYVFGALVRPSWIRVLNSCEEFLQTCVATKGEGAGDDDLAALVVEKTRSRLIQFASASGFDVHSMLRYGGQPMPSLLQIADDLACNHFDLTSHRRRTVMHGDLCFSNILYDSRIQRIHVIDPRGFVHPGKNTIFGDVRYDLGKLAHSIIGRYDQIIAGRYHLSAVTGRRYEISFEQAAHHAWLECAFSRMQVDGIEAGGREIRAIMVALFLSMLPLHADRPDRQEAFIANALRLYAILESPPR